MKTTKPISTISFNTENYLIGTLESLVKTGKLSFWAYIEHKPEDDEGGKKVHFHVYCEPAALLQTDDLRHCFDEYDPTNDKPKGTLKFVHSRFDEWYMYILHDRAYLASKNQTRRFHYRESQVVASDDDDLVFMVKSIDRLAVSPYSAMQDAIERGVTWNEFVARGTVPLPQFKAWETAWYTLTGLVDVTNRNGREGHANDFEGDNNV